MTTEVMTIEATTIEATTIAVMTIAAATMIGPTMTTTTMIRVRCTTRLRRLRLRTMPVIGRHALVRTTCGSTASGTGVAVVMRGGLDTGLRARM